MNRIQVNYHDATNRIEYINVESPQPKVYFKHNANGLQEYNPLTGRYVVSKVYHNKNDQLTLSVAKWFVAFGLLIVLAALLKGG